MGGERALVTGGAGFIGSELVRQAASEFAEVVVLDNLATGRRENLAGLPGERVRLVVGDVRDAGAVRRALRGVEVVFHLACLGVRHSLHSPLENHEVNARGTLVLLQAARDEAVRRFVHVSSSEVYGTARFVPMSEEHPTFPHTVYGASKLAGECYARAFWRSHGFPAVVVRPFNCFGPRCHHEGDSGEVIPRFLLRTLAGRPMVVFGDGSQTRDFTFVADAAKGILRAGLAEAAVGETLNLGSGREIPIRELAALVAEVAGGGEARVEHVEARPGDVRRLCGDDGKARRLLGYAPEVGLRRGLELLRDWYLAGPRSAAELLEEERVRNWTA